MSSTVDPLISSAFWISSSLDINFLWTSAASKHHLYLDISILGMSSALGDHRGSRPSPRMGQKESDGSFCPFEIKATSCGPATGALGRIFQPLFTADGSKDSLPRGLG
mmetsp:Transcript_58737/g.155396  ORF Transcript_58737/g.155396 Transcript_58737/m.155396 type:complete len:108 (-) Transcript_58737:69-392(-)